MSNKILDLVDVHKVDCDGHEMSFVANPQNENEYLAIISRKDMVLLDQNSTIVHNSLFFVHLDLNFNILKYVLMKSANNNHGEKERGIERCSLLNDHMFIGLVHGETDSKICLCHFKNDIIHATTELDTAGSLNPIILKYNLTNLFAIHSYTPFQIMSFNMESGVNQIIHMVHVFNEETFVVKRGSCVFLDDFKEYLLAIRVEKDEKYLCSVWVTLTERFKLSGISGHFLFNNTKTTINKPEETCTSLVVRNNTLYAAISADSEIVIYEFAVEKVHNALFKV
jgi:hypothetical protein